MALASLLLPVSLGLIPLSASAATSFTVTPMVIDGKGKVRDIERYTLTVVNTTKHLVSVYPWVTDLDPEIGSTGTTDLGGTTDKPLATSLSHWIEVTRGSIDLAPGEQKDVPLTVQIDLNAKPGLYHSLVHLSYGPDRASAEANPAETIDVAVNIEVLEDINERMELDSFIPTKNFFAGNNASFQYTIDNIGNRGEVPRGKIRIYDRNGREIATVEANKDSTRLEPSATQMIAAAWNAGDNFGHYKAMLDLEYGNHGTLQDTVFFWVLPWKKLFSMFGTLIVLCVAVAIVLHSRSAAQRDALAGKPRRRLFGLLPAVDDMYEDEYAPEEAYAEAYQEPRSSVRLGQRERRYYDEMTEVAAPAPVHTVRRDIDDMPRVPAHPYAQRDGHKVHLAKREKPKPDPRHIVNLKR